MSTVRDLIHSAARLINVVAASEQLNDADAQIFESALNQLLSSWSNNRLLIYGIQQQVLTLTPGAISFTIGPGGDLNTVRPMAIEQLYARTGVGSGQLDMPMQPLTDAQYAGISVKNTASTYPFAYYDDRAFPLRTVTLFPVPGSSQVVCWLRQPLLIYDSLDDEIELPPGYERAIRYNLAVEVAPEFGKEVPDIVATIGGFAKAELERLNSVPRYLRGDGAMSQHGQEYFNYITGNFNWGWGKW